MSSGIEKNVPLFTGDDYPGWSTSMESYLMASGVWHVIDVFLSDTTQTSGGVATGAQVAAPGGSALPGTQLPAVAAPATGGSQAGSAVVSAPASATSAGLTSFKSDKDWKMADIKAQGFIRMRVDNNIVDKLKPLACAFDMWALLEYGALAVR